MMHDWPTTTLALSFSLLLVVTAQAPSNGQFGTGTLNHTSVLAQLVSEEVEITPFIIGGDEAEVGEYPWMVRLVGLSYFNTVVSTCGGVLIRPDWVLSALHCVENDDGTLVAPIYTAFVGATDLNNFDAETYVFEGETYRPEYLAFEYYENVAIENVDLVILKLSIPSTLPHLDIPAEDTTESFGIVAGWGQDENGLSPSTLQAIDDLPLLPDSACSYYTSGFDLTYYRCAGNLEGIEGPCFGDSGGPLIAPNAAAKHGFDLIGTVVAGYPTCTRPRTTEIFTDLVFVKYFVEAIVGPPTTQPKFDPTPSPASDPGTNTTMCTCSCSCTNGLEYDYEHMYGDACT